MAINALTVTKPNKQTKFATFVKNRAMEDGPNAHDNSAANGYTKTVINTYNHVTTFSQTIMRKFIIAHFVVKCKKEELS